MQEGFFYTPNIPFLDAHYHSIFIIKRSGLTKSSDLKG